MVFVGEDTANLNIPFQLKFRPNYQVTELHTNPNFNKQSLFRTYIYDVALIKLNQSIRAGPEKSICLPESKTALDPNLNEYGMIAGWSRSDNEVLRLGYLKLNYEKDLSFEFIFTRKLDDIRIWVVSFSIFFNYTEFSNHICSCAG